MTRTVYYTATSVDGFIADQDQSLEWLLEVESDPHLFAGFLAGIGAFAMGANTYRWMLEHELVSGDVRPVHAEMVTAAAGRNVWVVGGGGLAAAFADRGLLDELVLQIAPVTLGAGAPLLPLRLPSSRLTLVDAERVGQFANLTYQLRHP